MENKIIIGDYQIVKCYEDSQGDTIWRIQFLEDANSEFVVHVSHNGMMYITYFPNCDIPFRKRSKLLKTLCEHINSQGYLLQIRIIDTNVALRNLCLAAGFKYLYRGQKRKKHHKHIVYKRFTVFYFPTEVSNY